MISKIFINVEGWFSVNIHYSVSIVFGVYKNNFIILATFPATTLQNIYISLQDKIKPIYILTYSKIILK
jgi:hypothetical protein